MDENWYALEQHMRDRIIEARAAARTRSLIRDLAPPRRVRYVLGVSLVRLGSWVLTRATQPPQELTHTLATLRAVLRSYPERRSW
jgi:hypothetical protein